LQTEGLGRTIALEEEEEEMITIIITITIIIECDKENYWLQP
jgi:hypothetical protein